jgi:Acyl-coenzyme A:6-aminopenicillanic acid acyl-transferase
MVKLRGEPRIYHARGSARAVGFANGRRLGPRLEQNIRHYIEQGPGRHTALDWDLLRSGALPWLRRLPERFQAELEGLAAGAGLPLQRIAEWCYVEECAPRGCSAFLCTTGGQTWVARNNDLWVPDLWGYATIREVEGCLPTIGFGLEGEPFIATGINGERLWLHYNYLPVWDSPAANKAVLPPYVLLTIALETCRTIGEVEALLSRTDRSAGMMIFATEGRTGTYAVFECSCSMYARREPAGGWLAGANHYLACATPMAAGIYAPNSVNRYARMIGLLGGQIVPGGAVDAPWDLVRILADPDVEQRGSDYGTVYANVVCPASGEIWYTFGGYPAASTGVWRQLEWPWV